MGQEPTNTTRGYVELNPAHGVDPVELTSHIEAIADGLW